MDNEIKKLLDEEIKAGIEDLAALTPGSKEKSVAIDDLVKLYKLRIEEIKNELDFDEKHDKRIDEAETRERETQLKKSQLEEQTKDRYFRLGVETAGILLPLIFYAFWMKKGFKFEETGTYTSATFRGLFNRFRPTK